MFRDDGKKVKRNDFQELFVQALAIKIDSDNNIIMTLLLIPVGVCREKAFEARH